MKSYTLSTLTQLTDSELVGDPEVEIQGVDDLETAGPGEATFLENSRYQRLLRTSKAGVIFISPDILQEKGHNYLVTPHPSLTFQKVIELFLQTPPSGFSEIDPRAVIHPEAQIGEGVSIAPNAVIDRGARIGDRTSIGPGVSIGAEVVIGSDSLLHPNVVVREGSQIGDRVVIQPGAVIGSCGFGYYTTPQGKHLHLSQLGIVILEDDVEIGANTTIDRARFKTTRIRRGTKIDNQVQIAHQVELGEHNIIVSQVGIAGSTKTGRHVVMGGQVGVVGHIEITDGVTIAARSGVSKGIKKSGIYMGIPAAPVKEFSTHHLQLRSIGKIAKRLKALEEKLSH
ncbi:MAG: UDP-3-O-acylglucosamine N-acyltransferase [Chlamydiae bacterium]|nr:UDP-3-O-acylglucosamine N-acyltransferase [Chlamydiota bacterium]